jgi:hypothetical protein
MNKIQEVAECQLLPHGGRQPDADVGKKSVRASGRIQDML